VGYLLKYRASLLKYGTLTLYLVDLQGSTGSNRELRRFLRGLLRYITQTYDRGFRAILEMFKAEVDFASGYREAKKFTAVVVMEWCYCEASSGVVEATGK
jgi:hypothetical protein